MTKQYEKQDREWKSQLYISQCKKTNLQNNTIRILKSLIGFNDNLGCQ